MLDIRIKTLNPGIIHDKILKDISDYEKKEIIKNKLINKYGFYIKKIAKNNTLPILQKERIEIKNNYDLNDFLKYYDEDFISNCYLGLLHRGHDNAGFERYLSKLRNGDLHKIEIIGRIALSKESRAKKIKVAGLKSRFLIRTFYRIPVIGYILRLLIIIIRLPKIINHQEQIENKIMAKANAISLFLPDESNLHEMAITKLINDINSNNDALLNGLGKLIQESSNQEDMKKKDKRILENEKN